MKIICIGRNYADHAKELSNPVPKEPVIFMKPDSAVLRNNMPFFVPEQLGEIHYELEIVLRINRLGKNIAERFAHKYYDEIGLGIDFTARDLQKELKSKGLPWEKAKAFDGSAVLSRFLPKAAFDDLNDINFHLSNGKQQLQVGNTKDLIFSFDQLVSYISTFFTLKIGDLIFTGTPAGVGPVAIGDNLEGYIEDKRLLQVPIR